MSNIYEPSTLQEFTWRIESLHVNSPNLWGKMNVAQMLAHCSIVLEVALGDRPLKRGIMGIIFGRLAKNVITNDKPFKRNLPTDKSFVVSDQHEFLAEQKRLLELLNRFSKAGPAIMEGKSHPFFGEMTADEWSMSQIKHLDHHLRQFGA